MVYEIVWTDKALHSYAANMHYLEEAWTLKEQIRFAEIVARKLEVISLQPFIGNPRDRATPNIRFTILNKRVALIYQVKKRQKQIELLLFWNMYRHPKRINAKFKG